MQSSENGHFTVPTRPQPSYRNLSGRSSSSRMNSARPRSAEVSAAPPGSNTATNWDTLPPPNRHQSTPYTTPRRRPVPGPGDAVQNADPHDSNNTNLLPPNVYFGSRDASKEALEDAISVRTEHTYLERRDLGVFDVAALIINKQIGTGIFTAPGLVLNLTGNKTVSIILWLSGGFWSLLSVLIYVEFGAAFPFNGGELIYLDEVFRRPELLATALFSAFFILVPNTDGNALQFAKHVLLAAENDNPLITSTEQLDRRLISLIAIFVLGIVCLLHYFSRNSGLLLNLVFAAYKILLLSVFIIAACLFSAKENTGRSDWIDPAITKPQPLAALVYIVYSYQGWENANYVGGELRVGKSALKYGAFIAVGTVTVLYTLITMAFSLACSFDDLNDSDLGVVSKCAPKIFGHGPGLKICVALSALGNLVAVVYTSSKVKQQIARQCILPFYKFFARQDKQFMTPAGALILHFVFAASWVIVTPNSSNGYGFIIGLFIYGQLIVGVFMGFAFFGIKKVYEAPDNRTTAANGGEKSRWHPVILKDKYAQWAVATIFIGMNLMVLVKGAVPQADPPRWLWPVVMFSVIAITTILWAILRLIVRKSSEDSPIEIRIVKDGQPIKEPRDEPALRKAKLEGNTRIIVYELHGTLKTIAENVEIFSHQLFKLIVR